MLFNSLEFAIFFPIVGAMYFMLPQRLRTPHLLVSSCVFYTAFIPVYILILALTIAIDYTAGLYLEKAVGRARSWLLVASVIATCLVLFVFKYFYFFTDNVIGLAGLFGWQLSGPSIHIILPIGLSFHTFQSLSYVVEVYRGRQKAEPNFVTYVRSRAFDLIGMNEATWTRRSTVWSSTFLLTCVGWVLFRSKTMTDAGYILTHFATDWDFENIGTEQFLMRQMPVAVAGIALLEAAQLLQNRGSLSGVVARLPLMARWTVYASAVIAMIMFGIFRQTQFIYFQF